MDSVQQMIRAGSYVVFKREGSRLDGYIGSVKDIGPGEGSCIPLTLDLYNHSTDEMEEWKTLISRVEVISEQRFHEIQADFRLDRKRRGF